MIEIPFFRDGSMGFMVMEDFVGFRKRYVLTSFHRITWLFTNVDYPAVSNAENHLNSTFDMIHIDPFTVKICFFPSLSRYNKEKPCATIKHIDDHKNCTLTLTHHYDLFPKRREHWVLSFEKDSQLLEPDDLRKEIVKEVMIIQEGK